MKVYTRLYVLWVGKEIKAYCGADRLDRIQFVFVSKLRLNEFLKINILRCNLYSTLSERYTDVKIPECDGFATLLHHRNVYLTVLRDHCMSISGLRCSSRLYQYNFILPQCNSMQ